MKRAFAIAAHPDDIEFVMAGTLILLQRAGYEIHYMNVANGCCGSTQWSAQHTAQVRAREALAAADLIGAQFHPSLVNDMEVFYDDRTARRLAAVVREVAPEILLTHAPADYMEDHMNTCRLAVTAAFARSMPNYATEPPRPPVDVPVTIYHAQPHGNCDPLGQRVVPQLAVDVTDVTDDKLRMLGCHASQLQWLDQSQGMSSYLEEMKTLTGEVGYMARELAGALGGDSASPGGPFTYAEGWRKHLYRGFSPTDDDPLSRALGGKVRRLSPSRSERGTE